jgi:hypothetical protein
MTLAMVGVEALSAAQGEAIGQSNRYGMIDLLFFNHRKLI